MLCPCRRLSWCRVGMRRDAEEERADAAYHAGTARHKPNLPWRCYVLLRCRALPGAGPGRPATRRLRPVAQPHPSRRGPCGATLSRCRTAPASDGGRSGTGTKAWPSWSVSPLDIAARSILGTVGTCLRTGRIHEHGPNHASYASAGPAGPLPGNERDLSFMRPLAGVASWPENCGYVAPPVSMCRCSVTRAPGS